MKLDQKATPVEINGGSAQSNFSIALNGKAFRVLSDTLYQNKIGSIVRELSCNAHDAHVMAGKANVPFVVHLPDAFEPWFSVQDQGVGLSDEDISSVFTVYFQSTKEQSNDTIGAFGLGAKTPFSYTDQFTVSSVKNNIRSIYNAFINEQGIPNIVKMFSEETTDGNGVEIKMSVKREDYNRFATEVGTQLKYFKVKPLLENTTSTGFAAEPNYLFNTPNVSIESDISTYSSSIYVVQGNVGYPLDITQIRNKLDATTYSVLMGIAYRNTTLKFNIGEIGVTASREGVEYTEKTVANICAKIDVVIAELTHIVKQKLATEFSTDYERAAYLNTAEVVRVFASNGSIPNFEFMGNQYMCNMRKFFMKPAGTTGFVKQHSRNPIRKTKFSGALTHITAKPESEIIVVFKDKSTSYSKKIQHLFFTSPKLQNVYCVEMYDKTYTKELIEQLSKHMGGFSNIKMLSDVTLPVVERDKTKRVQSTIPRYYKFDDGLYSAVRSYDKVFSDLSDIKEKTIYFTVDRLEPTAGSSDLYSLQDICDIEKIPQVIAIRESAVEKLENNPLFISLADYIRSTKEKLSTPEVKQQINRRFIIDSVQSALPYTLKEKKTIITTECKDNELAKIFNTLDQQEKLYSKKHSGNFKRFIGYTPESNPAVRKKSEKVVRVVKNILNKYAVVNTLGNTYHGKEISDQHLIVYLNAVQSYLQKH